MNSSLAYTANQRVERYKKSVEFIAEDVLLYKGFLGRTLKERGSLPTVGARAARAAGVIVDSLGKLRCPPGTPNANQFTDLSMSNCMVPGLGAARRLAQEAANSTQRMFAQAQSIMDSPSSKKKAKGVARVAALAALGALDALDYLNVDGSGSLTASTLAVAEVLRYGSASLAEAALNRLQRRGKITENQRKNLQAIVDKIGTTERFEGVAQYLSGATQRASRRARRMKPTRRDNRVPDADLTVADLGLPLEDLDGLDLYKPKLKTNDRDLSLVAGAPPEFSNRNFERLTQVTADADALSAALAQKKQNLLTKYVPGKENESVETYADELMEKMRVTTDKPFKEQLDEAMDFFMKTAEADAAEDMTPDVNLSAERNEINRIRGLAKLETFELTKTEEGKKQVREAMAQGYLEVLIGAELSMENNPSLRNATEMRIHKFGQDDELAKFAGYAKTELRDDGTISLVCTIVPHALPFDQRNLVGAEGTELAKGQSLSTVFRFAGSDDYQVGLGIHEYAHLEHFATQLEASGLRVGRDAPPLFSQMEGKLGDNIIGIQLARMHNFSTDATWGELQEVFKKSRGNDYESGELSRRHSVYGDYDLNQKIYRISEDYANSSRLVQRGKERNPLVELSTGKRLERELLLGLSGGGGEDTKVKTFSALVENLDSYDRQMKNPFAGMFVDNLTEEQKKNILSGIKMNKPYFYELIDNATGKEVSPEDIRKILVDAFEGQTPEEFLATHKKVMDGIFGIDTDFISTNGVPTDEIMAVLGKSSEYGKTNLMEAVAEARTLTTIAERFAESVSVKQMEEVTRMREMLQRVIPSRSAGVAQRNLTPEAREHFARIARMLGKLPALKMNMENRI